MRARPRAARLMRDGRSGEGLGHASGIHSLVEHTSINPNKAAHIGHLRNAFWATPLCACCAPPGKRSTCRTTSTTPACRWPMWWWAFCILKASRWPRCALLLEELKSKGERIDYYCWDLYARTSQWYEQGTDEENAARKKLRYATLHEIERGGNETAEIAELISTAVLRRHLETMLRSTSSTTFCPARARFCTSSSGTRPSSS
jgi:arginyl-tRNA synthetase